MAPQTLPDHPAPRDIADAMALHVHVRAARARLLEAAKVADRAGRTTQHMRLLIAVADVDTALEGGEGSS